MSSSFVSWWSSTFALALLSHLALLCALTPPKGDMLISTHFSVVFALVCVDTIFRPSQNIEKVQSTRKRMRRSARTKLARRASDGSPDAPRTRRG